MYTVGISLAGDFAVRWWLSLAMHQAMKLSQVAFRCQWIIQGILSDKKSRFPCGFPLEKRLFWTAWDVLKPLFGGLGGMCQSRLGAILPSLRDHAAKAPHVQEHAPGMFLVEPVVARSLPANHKIKNAPQGSVFYFGGLGRNRTTDTRIFSPLLYRLSYQAVFCTSRAPSISAARHYSGKPCQYQVLQCRKCQPWGVAAQ